MRRTSMFMLGVVYGGSLLCMGAGRIVSFFVANLPGGAAAMTVVMSVLVVVEMVLALRLAPTDRGLPLFSEVAVDVRRMASQAGALGCAATPTVIPATGVSHALGAEPPVTASPLGVLNDVERNIVELVVRGRSRSAIARELGYAENTVRNYLRNAYRKLGIHSKQELFDLVEGLSQDASE